MRKISITISLSPLILFIATKMDNNKLTDMDHLRILTHTNVNSLKIIELDDLLAVQDSS